MLTEVYSDPPGVNDGAVGREPTNRHQEFVELYLPTLADLAPGLDKDSLDLTLYEVDGDFSSPSRGLVNIRIDLPTFDLDPSNGLTGLARPANGTVVLGWVDYNAGVTDLAGTPGTRTALIDGGVTVAGDYTFIAINGNEFSGTTNFPTPVAISHLAAAERSVGFIENGSNAWLLVDRDAPGYVELYDSTDPCCVPPISNADPDLASGLVIATASMLDGFASNDDSEFDPLLQPYSPPTGLSIDFENDLPLAGAFSFMVPQLDEIDLEEGYALKLGDIGRTTDDANPANDDPVADAMTAYRTINPLGPFYATPGFVPLSTSSAELGVADVSQKTYEILAGTVGRPAVPAANVGGEFAMRTTATPGTPVTPGVFTVGAGTPVVTSEAQEEFFPTIEVAADIDEPHGAATLLEIQLFASNVFGGSPAVVNRNQVVTTTFSVLNPTQGLDAALDPYEATSFVAVQGLRPPTSGTNEFAQSSLGFFISTNLGGIVLDDRGNGAALVDPATDLGDPVVIDEMEQAMPEGQDQYINPSSAVDNLLAEVFTSPERLSGATTYSAVTFNAAFTAVRAIELGIPDVSTSGGVFYPTEDVHFADAIGRVGDPASGLTGAKSKRGFELALVDSHLGGGGELEVGDSDDFGIVVEIGRVRPGASVVPGEFVFLSMSGGLSGADLDSLAVPPFGTRTNIIYVDLDPLDTELGALSVSRVFLVDSGGNGAVNLIEAFVLAADGVEVPAASPSVAFLGAWLLAGAGIARLRRGR